MSRDGIILVVEDNPENAKLLDKILSKNNMKFAIRNDAYSGLDLLEKEKVALILLDISLPGMDGIEMVNKIRNELNLNSIPIIALTAHAMAEEKERALAAGFTAYMTKPFRPKELISAVKEYLCE